MIYITYRTKEMFEIDRTTLKRKYRIINDFLCKYSLNGEKSIVNTPVNDLISLIKEDEEQIYYEMVVFGYDGSIKGTEITSNWNQIFKSIDKVLESKRNILVEKYKDKKDKKSKKDFFKKVGKLDNKVIIVNMDNNLGQWQGIEILTAIKHNAKIYWISLDKLIKIIGYCEAKEPSDLNTQKLTFIKCLFKYGKQVKS